MAGQIVTKVGGFIGGIGRTFGSIFGLFFIRWRIAITIVFLLINSSGAIMDSVEDGNVFPLIKTVGARVFASDEDLYWKLHELEDNGWRVQSEKIESDDDGFFRDFKSSLSKINFFFYILFTGWYVYILIYFFYWLMKFHNDSEKFFDLLFAIIFVVIIQMLYGSTMQFINYDCSADNPDSCMNEEERVDSTLFGLAPLKGTVFLVKSIADGNLIDAFKESATPIIENLPFNESMNITNNSVF